MSDTAWGDGASRIRCLRWRDAAVDRRRCGKQATVALQVGRFRNGRWSRPYPVCQACSLLPWHGGRDGFSEQRIVSLKMYMRWLHGELVLDCYQRVT